VKKGDLVIGFFSQRIGLIISDPVTIVKDEEIIKEWVSVAWIDGDVSNSCESQYLEVIDENR
jgi:hypothetical protein